MAQKAPSIRERLDCTLVARGLAESREQASRLILAGAVSVDGVLADKQGKRVSAEAKIEVAPRAAPFVSRSGGKLQAGLVAFGVDPSGLVALDVGASTGGFTDCLPQRGGRPGYGGVVASGQRPGEERPGPPGAGLEPSALPHSSPTTVPE